MNVRNFLFGRIQYSDDFPEDEGPTETLEAFGGQITVIYGDDSTSLLFDLPAGAYSVSASFDGTAETQLKDLLVSRGQQQRLRVPAKEAERTEIIIRPTGEKRVLRIPLW